MNETPADHATPPDPAPRRQAAIVAFLGAGIEPAPSTAVLVSALAQARRAVAATHGRERALQAWLGSEVRRRGVRENAATLAAREVSRHRVELAGSYAQRHPDRARELTELLAVIAGEA